MATRARGEARADRFPPRLLSVIRVIDTVSDWFGRIIAWLIIPLVGSLTYEVFARYLFNAPTVWAYDVSYMLYGTFFMLGAGYALFRGGHIRTDMLYQNWSPRTQGAIDAACYLFLFFPAMLFLLWMGGQEAWHAWVIGERSDVELITGSTRVPAGTGTQTLYAILSALAVLEPEQPGDEAPHRVSFDLLDAHPELADERRFKVLFTSAPKGTIPATIWRSAHVVYIGDLPSTRDE